MSEPITADWLKSIGFRWHQLDRQPDKQWLLWLGWALNEPSGRLFTSYEDLGIELAPDLSGHWHCWLRADYSGRYTRFVHVRHLSTQAEVVALIEALVGAPFDPANVDGGTLLKPEQAAQRRAEWERLDRRLLRDRPPHSDIETDDTMGRPLPGHLAAHQKGRKA